MPFKSDRSSADQHWKNTIRSVICVLLAAIVLMPGQVMAQASSNPSGLPLPRFASTRSQPINVRVGPGTRYDIAWVFVKAGMPVEIIQEFDTWRKIRDVEGEEGWIHQNLLVGNRAAYVTPWVEDNQIALRAGSNPDSGVRAWLPSHFLVQIDECDGSACSISARDSSGRTFSGFVGQDELWGVYPDEEFD